MLSFKLLDEFVNTYTHRDPNFGFNGLGLFTYYRTYSRLKADGSNEQWFETVRRVVEGAYSIQKEHILNNELGWNDIKAQKSAQEMYDRIFTMKFLPPGRMLWALGTPIIHEKKVGQALFNCAFVSTASIHNSLNDALKPFTFMMDMSMVGVGVGFDVDGANRLRVQSPDALQTNLLVVADTREGWVQSLEHLLSAYFSAAFTEIKPAMPVFDYSLVRPAGVPIKGFGGISSGPAPLIKLHEQVRGLLDGLHGQMLSTTAIADIMNMIGQCVIAGNVRRTAQIALGPANDVEYRSLKDYRWNPETLRYEGSQAHRAAWGWASNNSVIADDETPLGDLAHQTAINGEPGYIFLNNIRKYSRMKDPADFKDIKAVGTNPCGEQSLESYELCCLVETFPTRAESKEDFLRTLKFAYLLGKTATLINTTWPETNRVQKRNRRIGTSVSGITNFLSKQSLNHLKTWLEEGYDTIQHWDSVYSSWLCVPRSIKTTSVKPSGTVSLLAGVNPGCHFPEANYYIRRVRVSRNSSLLKMVQAAGFRTEDDQVDPSSAVVEFPVHSEGRTLKEVGIWEQVQLLVFLQRYWSDNQVSCTVTFKPEEQAQIQVILDYLRYDLKSISFLPKLEYGVFAQMPYEAIHGSVYETMLAEIKHLDFSGSGEDVSAELFCNNDTCTF